MLSNFLRAVVSFIIGTEGAEYGQTKRGGPRGRNQQNQGRRATGGVQQPSGSRPNQSSGPAHSPGSETQRQAAPDSATMVLPHAERRPEPSSYQCYSANPFWFVPTDGKPSQRLSLEQWGVYDAKTRRRPAACPADDPRHLLTGRIEVKLKALTALHMGGKIETHPNGAMRRRYFYRRIRADEVAGSEGRPVVEGSSLRGMLRAYVEALTNGIASSYVVGFESASGRVADGRYVKRYMLGPNGRPDASCRHIGFWVGEEPADASSSRANAYDATFEVPDGGDRFYFGDRAGRHLIDEPSEVWIPREFGKRRGSNLATEDSGICADAATLMFGLVALDADRKERPDGTSRDGDEAESGRNPDVPVHALRGRVRVGDAWFGEDDLERKPDGSLDLTSAAIMGGPKPSRSSAWYFPAERFRVRSFRGKAFRSVEFIGARRFRGRKFYFHQTPDECIKWYLDNWKHQTHEGARPRLISVGTERLKAGATSEAFALHFEDLPRCLVELLVVALRPSCGVRHKVGALKAFGYGSVEFELVGVKLEPSGPEGLDLTSSSVARGSELENELTLLAEATDRTEYPDFAGQEGARELQLADTQTPAQKLVCPTAWKHLRTICYYPEEANGVAQQARLRLYPLFYSPPRGEATEPFERGFALPVEPGLLGSEDVVGRGTRDQLPREGALKDPVAVMRRIANSVKRPIDIDVYQEGSEGWDDWVRVALNSDEKAR